MLGIVTSLISISSARSALSWVRRNLPKAGLALLIAAALWFAYQSWRLGGNVADLESKVTAENLRANKAEIDLAAAQATIIRGEQAATADQSRTRAQEAATARAKESIDALTVTHGSTPVSPLTRDHLQRVRQKQR